MKTNRSRLSLLSRVNDVPGGAALDRPTDRTLGVELAKEGLVEVDGAPTARPLILKITPAGRTELVRLQEHYA